MVDALSEAHSIQCAAAQSGFDWPDVAGAFDKLREEIEELGSVLDGDDFAAQREELGDVLFSVVNVSRFIQVDAAEALHGANHKFSERFRKVQELAEINGRDMSACSLAELDALWERSKADSGDPDVRSG
jgi:uncharacterized protein YabN with tetrapyrrole methylase and pyrophosphatase domain